MTSQHACTAARLPLGVLVFATTVAGSALAQSTSSPAAASGPASPWNQQVNADAVQADAWFQNYKFRNGGTLERLKIHYATLGTPHRNANGDIDNAILVLHWTGAARTCPVGVVQDRHGALLVADDVGNVIRRVTGTARSPG